MRGNTTVWEIDISEETFTFTFICLPGKTHNHRSRGDTPWKAQTTYQKKHGGGAGSLKILTGVLVHRVTRPLRGSVSCGSGWSVPCVSIQLTLSRNTTVLRSRVQAP